MIPIPTRLEKRTNEDVAVEKSRCEKKTKLCIYKDMELHLEILFL